MVECLISKQKVLGSVLSSKGVGWGVAKGKAGRIDLGTSLLRKISPQCSARLKWPSARRRECGHGSWVSLLCLFPTRVLFEQRTGQRNLRITLSDHFRMRGLCRPIIYQSCWMWPTSSDSMVLRNNSKRNQVCKPSLEETAPVHIAMAKIGLH